MTAGLAEACAGLRTWLPAAAALLAEPDTDGTAGHGKAGSRPPWNQAAANAVFGACEEVLRLEQGLRAEVTGRPGRRRAYSGTGATIRLVAALGVNASRDSAEHAAREIAALVAVIQQLPAIDEAERFTKVSGARCPYCELPMLRLGERSGRVACLRYGSCFDRNDEHPTGFLTRSVSGEAMIAWADGFNQYAAVTWEDGAVVSAP